MLLRTLMREHLGQPHFAAQSKHMHCLDFVGQFEFGETYNILLLSGVRVEVKQLETLLECMRDEFKEAETYDALLGRPRQVRGTQIGLVVKPKAVMGTPWGRNVPKLCNNIRGWVTHYNLSGEWPDIGDE